MGEVFLAADERRPPQRTFVALKTVHGDLADDEGFRSRFRREIETGRAVSGRYTARLIDGDADGAPPWLATEYVPGPNLEEVVRGGGPLPEPAVRALGRGLVAALRSIHHARVLHRDMKPANVLLTKAGPKVIDFGIARVFGASTMTATGLPGEMLFRAYRESDGQRIWETKVKEAYPNSMTPAAGRLYLAGPGGTWQLDQRDGRLRVVGE